MILLPCPWCGPRNVAEFQHLGEATPRPDPATASPGEWRDYLYVRDNPYGWVTEKWYHRFGCRRFFSVRRDTGTNEVVPLLQGEAAERGREQAGGASS